MSISKYFDFVHQTVMICPRYNIPVDKTRSPKVGGFQGKEPEQCSKPWLMAGDYTTIL